MSLFFFFKSHNFTSRNFWTHVLEVFKGISKYLFFRPGTCSRLPSGLPGKGEEGSFRGRIRLSGVRTFVSAHTFINRLSAVTSEWVSRYKYDWKIEEARKNILRTHTTAVSARMLYKLAQQVSVTHDFGLTSFTYFTAWWCTKASSNNRINSWCFCRTLDSLAFVLTFQFW